MYIKESEEVIGNTKKRFGPEFAPLTINLDIATVNVIEGTTFCTSLCFKYDVCNGAEREQSL